MTRKTYSEKLKDPRWQKKRLEILQRDEWKCQLCKDSYTTLAVHHNSYNGDPWETPDSDLTTVCEHCHSLISSQVYKEFHQPAIAILKRVRNEHGFIFYAVKTKENSIGIFLYYIEPDVYEYCIGVKEEVFKEVISFFNS